MLKKLKKFGYRLSFGLGGLYTNEKVVQLLLEKMIGCSEEQCIKQNIFQFNSLN